MRAIRCFFLDLACSAKKLLPLLTAKLVSSDLAKGVYKIKAGKKSPFSKKFYPPFSDILVSLN